MNDLAMLAPLSATFIFIAAHVLLVGLLRPRVPADVQKILFAWGRVRGGRVLSLRFRYLLPWAHIPPLPSSLAFLLKAAQASASLAVVSLLAFVIAGVAQGAA
jgi:hypothetical protein